ncbi:hemerythrin domain-containing protein [Leeia sp. TBRC 13508]|uniref:Hemerythrin domain-containing protein n=1 Tax=Leeia speluncae TaxID=2884804 RepID=A0ABS8D8S1_9NEIS|nr:hemerythrin domain-containing protein [Leeia speluncae]MCB6184517.1 hemerythrin domain-containing protein [Leeia speluncae]
MSTLAKMHTEDHFACERHLQALIIAADTKQTTDCLRSLDSFRDEFLAHLAMEENSIFNRIVEAMPNTESTIKKLRKAHDEMRVTLDNIAKKMVLQDFANLAELSRDLQRSLQDHANDEEKLFIAVGEVIASHSH